MVIMVFTPCFAQEIESEGIFSIEGAYWRSIAIVDGMVISVGKYGFYDGKIYLCLDILGCYNLALFCPACSYTDFSLLTFVSVAVTDLPVGDFTFKGYLFPLLGLGVGFGHYYIGSYRFGIVITFTKISNNWIPPEVE